MRISLKKLKELKSYPKDVEGLTVSNHAKLIIHRTPNPNLRGSKFIYRGIVMFVYKNGVTYKTTVARTGSFGAVREKSISYYEQRNRQMLQQRKASL